MNTKTFIVPVTIQNETALSDVGKTYEIVKGNTVNVTVTAPRSILNDMEEEDILATADFSKLSYTYAVPIEVKILKTDTSNCTIDTNQAMMQLKLDEIAELSLDFQIEQTGTPSEGYCVTDLSSNIKSIFISGGSSIIKTIDKAVLKVDVSEKSEDFTELCQVEIYDKNGTKLSLEDFELSETEVIVNGTVLPIKEIPISITLENEETNEYHLISVKQDLETLNVAGTDEQLEQLESLDIKIDLSQEQINETLIKTLNLKDYLPENIFLADNNKKINISMQFDIFTEKEFEISTDRITILNIKENYECNYKNNTFKLIFKGTEDNLNAINLDDLKFYLDLNNLNRGNYNLPIKIDNLPEGVVLVSENIIQLEVTKK